MNTANAFFVEPPPPTFMERLRGNLFPERAISNPEMEHRDVFVCRTACHFAALDRIRILFTGKVMVETRTATENEIGAHRTKSVAYPLL